MEYAQKISSLVLSLRKKQKLRVRQPLQKILLPVLNESFIDQVEKVKDLILHEVNVKEIEYVTDTSGIIKKKIKPNFKTLGRLLGKNMKDAAAVINTLSQEEISEIEKTEKYLLELNGEKYELGLEDFIISAEDIPGWLVANEGELTVALDITLTDNLKAEGLARELVNRIQNVRKSSDFDVTDRIVVELTADELLKEAIQKFGDYIKSETLADDIIISENVDGEEIELTDNVKTILKVKRS
jgi:isoleucyl-tRNA synthetase